MIFENSEIAKILDVLLSDWFWLFILGLIVLGRNFLWSADVKFYPKKPNEFTEDEKKKVEMLKFFGGSLFFISAPFMIFFACFLIFYAVNR